jgi:hypothetical protein
MSCTKPWVSVPVYERYRACGLFWKLHFGMFNDLDFDEPFLVTYPALGLVYPRQ